MIKLTQNSEEKIDWVKKFKEFIDIYLTDNTKKKLLLSYFTFAKLMKREIQSSDFENIYKEIFKE